MCCNRSNCGNCNGGCGGCSRNGGSRIDCSNCSMRNRCTGFQSGFNAGFEAGRVSGFNEGYQAGIDAANRSICEERCRRVTNC